jgi:hypothetical protein
MKKAFTFLLTILILACQKQSIEPTVYSIDKDLEVYMKSFIDEAQKRGIEVKAENLILKFGSTSEEICGQCSRVPKDGQRTIIINNDLICWKTAVVQNREALVFHELGHCILDRNHRDENLPNGTPASIMNSNFQISGLYEPCIYAISGDTICNKTSRRAYYIDELFNAKTAVPFWGK